MGHLSGSVMVIRLFGCPVPTLFPSPFNVNEARFLAACNAALSVASILAGFQHSVDGHSVQFGEAPFILRAIHCGSLLVLLTLGPNFSPSGWAARFCAVYGIGNKVEPCAGAPKFVAQCVALLMVSVSLICTAMLGPQAIPSFLPLLVLTFFSCLDALFGFCVACWVYMKTARLLKIDVHETFTEDQLRDMYKGWPLCGPCSNNVQLHMNVYSGQHHAAQVNVNDSKPTTTTAPSTKWETVCENGLCKIQVIQVNANDSKPITTTAPSTNRWESVCENGVCKIQVTA